MNRMWALIASAVLVVVAADASRTWSSGPARSLDGRIVVAALSPEQAAACESERQALQQRLNQCTSDDCRRAVQAEIDAHNARCQ